MADKDKIETEEPELEEGAAEAEELSEKEKKKAEKKRRKEEKKAQKEKEKEAKPEKPPKPPKPVKLPDELLNTELGAVVAVYQPKAIGLWIPTFVLLLLILVLGVINQFATLVLIVAAVLTLPWIVLMWVFALRGGRPRIVVFEKGFAIWRKFGKPKIELIRISNVDGMWYTSGLQIGKQMSQTLLFRAPDKTFHKLKLANSVHMHNEDGKLTSIEEYLGMRHAERLSGDALKWLQLGNPIIFHELIDNKIEAYEEQELALTTAIADKLKIQDDKLNLLAFKKVDGLPKEKEGLLVPVVVVTSNGIAYMPKPDEEELNVLPWREVQEIEIKYFRRIADRRRLPNQVRLNTRTVDNVKIPIHKVGNPFLMVGVINEVINPS